LTKACRRSGAAKTAEAQTQLRYTWTDQRKGLSGTNFLSFPARAEPTGAGNCGDTPREGIVSTTVRVVSESPRPTGCGDGSTDAPRPPTRLRVRHGC
jgi:hypothetical protein